MATRSPRVLLVQHDPALLSGIQSHLSRQGYEVFATPGPADMLRQVYQLRPDVVMLGLPRSLADPWAALRSLRSLRALSDVPILLIMEHDGERERAAGRELGADCVSVPFVAEDIVARIHSLVRGT